MEIGSEFYTNSTKFGVNEYNEIIDYPKRYTLSGRTGLSLIASELKDRVKRVSLPSYCCGSMIAPFYKLGFSLTFYNPFDLNNVKFSKSKDAILIMDYFGFLSKETISFAERCKRDGKIIILDGTQTAFSYSPIYDFADYIVISYRKWFDCLCAVVYSKTGFSTSEIYEKNSFYAKKWRRAALLKEKYIRHGEGGKQEFLDMFYVANKMLDNNFEGYNAEPSEIEILKNVDSSYLRKVRRENAKILMEHIMKLSEKYDVRLMNEILGEEDCPLFVPIIISEEKRNVIRNELIKHNVYCPIHWPIDKRYPYQETVCHKRELSLICDQRYGSKDMKRQIEILTKALEYSI